MTLLIGVVYGVGALELLKFRRATTTLTHALADIPGNLSPGFGAGSPPDETSPPEGLRGAPSDERGGLDAWLGKLHSSLQDVVRLRVEGERIGLPGPALTPYLVGLLVMLGMLGTFLGMVVTLNGAVFALEGTTDLQTIRSSMAAPIKGLGLAFGTSLAGVASSAMLGLISALVRRERLQAGQLLDRKIATVLRGFSLTHQRQETFKALQLQAQALPSVVDKLQTMMTMMEHQSKQLNERLLTNQESFHGHIKGVYTELAGSVDKSLKDSLTSSARVAGETIKPLAEATMTGMAREATLMHERMISTTQTQLDELSTRIGASAIGMAQSWSAALSQQEGSNDKLLSRVGQALHAFGETFEQRSASLVSSIGESYASLQAEQATGNQQQLATWTQSLESIGATLQREWQQAGVQTLAQQQQICTALDQTARQMTEQAQTQEKGSAELLGRVDQSLQGFSATFEQRSASLVTTVSEAYATLQANQATDSQQRLATWTQSLESMAATLQREWQQAGVQTLAQQQQICTALEQTARQMTEQAQTQEKGSVELLGRVDQTLQAFSENFEQRSASLVSSVSETYATLQANQDTDSQQKLATWTHSLESMAATLQSEWQQAGAQTLAQQQQICTTLEKTVQQVIEQTQTHSSHTLTEITHLLDTAAQAPRAAAEVIAQLRQELSSSMARDNAMLEERSHILETLSALLNTINHASTEQRSTIDALVASSEELLSRVGNQFAEKLDAESARLSDSAAHVISSAVEVSSLSESFNFAVQLFNESNEKLIANLQRIEASMDKSMARSDDQLAYYVAQAREIIDLSIMSQKEVFEDMRQLSGQQASLGEKVN
ncbi:DUF802 domain-containing protein [Polaromonas sp. OV174]|uniref:DUF802 domain-containing protein n=1 Tax=Polaromonas sp. OV174 TaxID=1855300 RepID=UPI003515A2DB